MTKDEKRFRIIMHDMSDFALPEPSDGDLNKALWSKYYGGPCGKGGIFTQLCGWEGTHELFTGNIGDSEYVKLCAFLKDQEEFANMDTLQDGSILPFINVFDKGYRVNMECLKYGKQLCWQPVFAESDKRYGRYATLLTAVVAYTRSGNERSVKHIKHSWFLAHGSQDMPNIDLEMVADIWLA